MTIKEVSEKYDISQDTLRYYERIGMIPPVTRTSSGIRDYQESDLGWVEHVICMRSAGLPVESIIEYVKLCQEGDETIPARLQLLVEQRKKSTLPNGTNECHIKATELQNRPLRNSRENRRIILGLTLLKSLYPKQNR